MCAKIDLQLLGVCIAHYLDFVFLHKLQGFYSIIKCFIGEAVYGKEFNLYTMFLGKSDCLCYILNSYMLAQP